MLQKLGLRWIHELERHGKGFEEGITAELEESSKEIECSFAFNR
jgi:hypothetical protein